MRHRVAGRKLGRRSEHREALMNNLVSQLLRHERVTTTEAKAREVRALAEKIISKGETQRCTTGARRSPWCRTSTPSNGSSMR